MLCQADYPNRLSYKLIDEAGAIVKKRLDGAITDRQSNEQLGSLIARYDDPGSLDKLSQVNTRVEEVKLKLNDNLTNLVTNQMDVEVLSAHQKLEANSHNLRNEASAFEKGSGDLKKIMYWRNLKLTVCIALIVVIMIIVIILIFTGK